MSKILLISEFDMLFINMMIKNICQANIKLHLAKLDNFEGNS